MKSKAHHNIKVAFWVMLVITVVAFGALLTILHGTIRSVGQDPSLVTLTTDGILRFVQIKNAGDAIDLQPGLYIITEDNDENLSLEGPQTNLFNKDIFLLDETYVRKALGGFMLEGQKYYRKITVSCPGKDILLIEVETQNSRGESYFQSTKLKK